MWSLQQTIHIINTQFDNILMDDNYISENIKLKHYRNKEKHNLKIHMCGCTMRVSFYMCRHLVLNLSDWFSLPFYLSHKLSELSE